MIESIVAIVVVVLLVVFLTVRKKKTAARAVFAPAQKPTPTKSDAKEPQQAVVKPEIVIEEPKQVVVETVAAVAITPEKPVVTAACCANPLLPQDSVLKRHYLHHIQTMVTELHSARPCDSILRRHYDSFIAAKIAECVASKAALQQLIQAYEAKPKTKVKPVIQTVQIAEPVVTPVVEIAAEPVAVTSTPAKIVRIPEDSTLKRHYMTQIHALAAAKLPDRPSDSILRRHYDTLLTQEVEKQLATG